MHFYLSTNHFEFIRLLSEKRYNDLFSLLGNHVLIFMDLTRFL